MLWLLKYLPQNYVSTFVGHLMHTRLPGPLRVLSIRIFAGLYKINVDEAEKPVNAYGSIGDFFIRKLKPGVRPIAAGKILHPADAVINALGAIKQGKILQAKQKPYSVEKILGSFIRTTELADGFFVTYYLCPTDYHRVHSPVTGKILSAEHVPGRLWPVYQKSVDTIDELFGVNERIILTILTEEGLVSLVFVGAMNVGRIELAFDAEFYSQVPGLSERRLKKYEQSILVSAGQELGLFRMGSTVVMFYPKSYHSLVSPAQLQNNLGKAVKYGSSF